MVLQDRTIGRRSLLGERRHFFRERTQRRLMDSGTGLPSIRKYTINCAR